MEAKLHTAMPSPLRQLCLDSFYIFCTLALLHPTLLHSCTRLPLPPCPSSRCFTAAPWPRGPAAATSASPALPPHSPPAATFHTRLSPLHHHYHVRACARDLLMPQLPSRHLLLPKPHLARGPQTHPPDQLTGVAHY